MYMNQIPVPPCPHISPYRGISDPLKNDLFQLQNFILLPTYFSINFSDFNSTEIFSRESSCSSVLSSDFFSELSSDLTSITSSATRNSSFPKLIPLKLFFMHVHRCQKNIFPAQPEKFDAPVSISMRLIQGPSEALVAHFHTPYPTSDCQSHPKYDNPEVLLFESHWDYVLYPAATRSVPVLRVQVWKKRKSGTISATDFRNQYPKLWRTNYKICVTTNLSFISVYKYSNNIWDYQTNRKIFFDFFVFRPILLAGSAM